MTDDEAIKAALISVEAAPGVFGVMRRNGRALMALPSGRKGAFHALSLYQPQRPKAVLAAAALRIFASWGLHRFIFAKVRHHGGVVALSPPMPSCLPGTAGVLLGSPEHPVRRAVLSYQMPEGWEVAKLAFGSGGREVIASECAALAAMPHGTPGLPEVIGIHHGEEFSLLRLPYIHGGPLKLGQRMRGMELLKEWIGDPKPKTACEFPEWEAIRTALETKGAGVEVWDRIAKQQLCPVIRHGDFARWNLLSCKDGTLVAIDWEWGHAEGMPGLDLVHYFLQDARLVERLGDEAAIAKTLGILGSKPCKDYLDATGWHGSPLLPIIASLAWKQGAGHQDNASILGAALAALQSDVRKR